MATEGKTREVAGGKKRKLFCHLFKHHSQGESVHATTIESLAESLFNAVSDQYEDMPGAVAQDGYTIYYQVTVNNKHFFEGSQHGKVLRKLSLEVEQIVVVTVNIQEKRLKDVRLEVKVWMGEYEPPLKKPAQKRE